MDADAVGKESECVLTAIEKKRWEFKLLDKQQKLIAAFTRLVVLFGMIVLTIIWLLQA